MKQDSTLTRNLAAAQDKKWVQRIEGDEWRTNNRKDISVLYRIYTETVPGVDIPDIVSRYFLGATILTGTGVWYGQPEPCTVIEILGTPLDLQSVVHLAGDIRVQAQQSSVLVQWSEVSSLQVTDHADF